MQKLIIMSDGTYLKAVRVPAWENQDDVDWDFIEITKDEFDQLQETLPVEREKNVEVVDWTLYIRGQNIDLEPYHWITISSFTTQDFENARASNFGDNKFKHICYQWYENWLNERDIRDVRKYEKQIDWDIYIPNKKK